MTFPLTCPLFLSVFGIFRRLRALEAESKQLRSDVDGIAAHLGELDPAELLRLRQTVLNALRGLNRSNQAQDQRSVLGPPSTHPWVRKG